MQYAGPGKIPSERDDWFRERVLPLYGLPPSWSGLRMTGDSHRAWIDAHDGRGPQRTGWEMLGLCHGNPLDPSGGLLQVISATLPGPQAHDLLKAESHRAGSGVEMRSTSPVTTVVRVEGEPIVFEGLEDGSGWVLQATLGPTLLSIVGVHWPREGLDLVRVPDVEPYIAGFHNFLRSQNDSPQK